MNLCCLIGVIVCKANNYTEDVAGCTVDYRVNE